MPKDDLDESEFPDETDTDQEGDGPATIDCPYCGQEILDDAELCPQCKNYISKEDAPQRRGWVWYVAVAVVALLLVLVVLRIL